MSSEEVKDSGVRRQVRVECSFNAPIREVWDVVTDHRGMNRWLVPGMKITLDPPGADDPNGVGAERVIHRLGFKGRERVLSFEPPHTMTYTVVSGIPIKNHLGTLELAERGADTLVVWTVCFEPIIPGSAKLIEVGLGMVLGGGLRRLAARMGR